MFNFFNKAKVLKLNKLVKKICVITPQSINLLCLFLLAYFHPCFPLQKRVSVLPSAATSMARWVVVRVVAAVCLIRCLGCRASPWLPVETPLLQLSDLVSRRDNICDIWTFCLRTGPAHVHRCWELFWIVRPLLWSQMG